MDPLIKEVAQVWAAKGDDGSPDWEDYVEDVTIAVNLVRERIAAEIEAEARQVLTDDGAGQVERAALLDAARIARGVN